MLIGQHEAGGLRQVIVKDGRLALTRMTPPSEGGLQGPGWVEGVIHEFKATLTYITRFGYAADDGLDVIVVCGDAEKKIFDQKTLPVTNFQCIRIADALAVIGSRGRSLGEINFGDALHAAWASKKMFLAVPIEVPSIQRIMIPRLASRIASVALVFSFLILVGLAFSVYSEYVPLKDSVAQKRSQKVPLDLEYGQEAKKFAALPVKPFIVRKTLAVQELLDDSSINITPTLNVLRNALDDDIRLEELTVEHSPAAVARNRGSVKIVFRFTFAGRMSEEQKVGRTERVAQTMKQFFPGYDVVISAMFGRISRGGKFESMAGAASGATALARAENFAEIEMQGAPL